MHKIFIFYHMLMISSFRKDMLNWIPEKVFPCVRIMHWCHRWWFYFSSFYCFYSVSKIQVWNSGFNHRNFNSLRKNPIKSIKKDVVQMASLSVPIRPCRSMICITFFICVDEFVDEFWKFAKTLFSIGTVLREAYM